MEITLEEKDISVKIKRDSFDNYMKKITKKYPILSETDATKIFLII
jgi:hypothetical protein